VRLRLLLTGLFTAIGLCGSRSAAVEIVPQTPLDYQVVQRSTPATGRLWFSGELSGHCPEQVSVEARLRPSEPSGGAAGDPADATPWRPIPGAVQGNRVRGSLQAAAGGWWRLEIRLLHDKREIARAAVPHVGVGEVFVVAGQSNAANHGEERQIPRTGRVASFDGSGWRLALDPQPGASGGQGSFMPPLGDALVERLGVPVGFVACGIGATSVREWLPAGATFPAPPTIESRVERRPDGLWASKGEAFDRLVARMRSLGPAGFRAVLWHQGESDANQQDATRTLPGPLYREYLGRLIRDSRRAIGWDPPWFVARASYHVPGDERSDDIRAAQAAVVADGLALSGPDSDALGAAFRERGGKGVHFSGSGLRAHAAAWADAILPWLDAAWTAPRPVDGGTEWTRFEMLPECHSIGWVARHVAAKGPSGWDGVLDEARWGTPSPQQAVSRNWDWAIRDEDWQAAVESEGEGLREEVRFDLWVPDGVEAVRGVVVISGHGSGEGLFRRPDLRALAGDLRLAVFTFLGNPLQRGFWPRRILFERLESLGTAAGHPECGRAPLFLYGHSNGTGFSALFAADEPERVWGWISMRPGITFQVYQPRAAKVPGLVIFGEEDHFLARPSREENLAVVPTLRRRHEAVWSMAVEPKTGHGPGEETWPLVYSFLRHSFRARVPADADARRGPVPLVELSVSGGHLGEPWDAGRGGYQSLAVAPFAAFTGDRSRASWLVNAAYAADWQAFHRDGRVAEPAPQGSAR
jgi:hypothetical protein